MVTLLRRLAGARGAVRPAVLIAGGVAASAVAVAVALSSGGGAAPGTANLWIDANGGTCTRQSSAGPYADAAACGSLQAAWAASQNGDSVIIKTGSYSDLQISAGTRSPPVTMTVEAGGTATFIGAKPSIDNANGLVLDGTAGAGTYGFRTALGLDQGGASNLTVKGWYIHDNAHNGAEATALYMLNCSNVLYQHIRVENWFAADGIQPWSQTGTPGCNGLTFDHVDQFNLSCSGTAGDHQDFMQIFAGSNITVKNSIWDGLYCHTISGATSGSQGFFLDPIGFQGLGSNIVLENSVIANIDPLDEGAATIAVYLDSGIVIRNNTLVGQVKTERSPAPPASITTENNIMVDSGCTPIQILFDTKGTGTYGHNVLSSDCGNGNGDTVAPSIDALFVDRAGHDWHLAPGSFAIDKGSATDFPSTDLDGNARPLGSAADAGAYEKG